MTKILTWTIVLLALGAGGWTLLPGKAKTEKKVETRIAKVERGDIVRDVVAGGEIKPLREVELKSKASGQVVRFKKAPGDPVAEGELIAELDKKLEQRNLDRELSNLSGAEARLLIARLQASNDVRQAEGDVAAARADEAQKRKELERLEKLANGLITESELSGATLAFRLGEEKARQAESALAFIRGRKQADEKLATADVEKARVAVEDVKERLRDTELGAPMKGILLKKLVEEGQIVASGISASTGGTALAVVADVSKLLVISNVDETDILKLKLDQPAEITLLSGSSDRFKGRVELIPPQAELDSNIIVFKVRVGMDGKVFGRAYSGMTASVSILVAEKKNALLVPSEAIRMEKRKKVVYIPDGLGSKPVTVRTGLDNGIMTEIVEGLEPETQIYVTHTSLPEQKAGGGRGRSMRF